MLVQQNSIPLWRVHFSCSGEFPDLLVSVPLSFSHDWCESNRWPLYQGSPQDNGQYRPTGLAGRGFGMLLPALVKNMTEFFETLVAILHFFSHRSRSLRYVSWCLTNRLDVTMMAVSSAQRANSTWREGEGMSLIYIMNMMGEINSP